jgi:fructokinase
MTAKSLDVVGIGNAIVDVLVQSDDAFLASHGLTKGTMALVDEDQAERLYASVGAGLETSGGSAANTLAGIAQLGGRAGFIGRVRDDQLGAIFSHDIRAVGTRFDTPAATTGASTARCLILVTPDAQRTMCTYLGASVGLDPADLDLELVAQAKVLYLEGYLWDSEAAKRAFIAAAEVARANGGEVALSLSDAFCVERHRDSFQELVDGHVDILFANEMEITSLYATASFEEALEQVRGRCRVPVGGHHGRRRPLRRRFPPWLDPGAAAGALRPAGLPLRRPGGHPAGAAPPVRSGGAGAASPGLSPQLVASQLA